MALFRQLFGDPLRCPFYGFVAGAAADVAVDSFVELRVARPLFSQQGTGERHDKTGGAEAALAAVAVHHSLLHRGEFFPVEAFDGDDVPAVRIGQRHDAGTHILVAHPTAFQRARQHGAGCAFTFLADELRAFQPLLVADEAEQAAAGRRIGADFMAV